MRTYLCKIFIFKISILVIPHLDSKLTIPSNGLMQRLGILSFVGLCTRLEQ